MDILISQYLDDEMNLDEKEQFVGKVHDDDLYFKRTIQFIKQEKSMKVFMQDGIETDSMPENRKLETRSRSWVKGLSLISAAAVIALFFIMSDRETINNIDLLQHRFVLYQPGVEKVEIAGSFTDWKPVNLVKSGEEGYWEITLKISSDEHKFSYIIDQQVVMADPTVALVEKDEFGSVNSIFKVRDI